MPLELDYTLKVMLNKILHPKQCLGNVLVQKAKKTLYQYFKKILAG